jgi:DNA-directed RNA polymerase subunit RPC12/RpoP
MRGIFPCFVLIGAIIALGALALSRRRPPSIEHNPVRCSNCETPMSLRRVPFAKSQVLLGEWECPHCRTRMHKGRISTSRSGS